jgi:hypothetical protein
MLEDCLDRIQRLRVVELVERHDLDHALLLCITGFTPILSTDPAMTAVSRAARADNVSKRTDSAYKPGRSRRWRKAKHKSVETVQVVGWRPSTPGRPGGVILAESGEPIGLAALAMPEPQRVALLDLLQRYGRQHPTVIPRVHLCRSQRRPLPPLAGSSQCSEAIPERLTAGRHRAPSSDTKPDIGDPHVLDSRTVDLHPAWPLGADVGNERR